MSKTFPVRARSAGLLTALSLLLATSFAQHAEARGTRGVAPTEGVVLASTRSDEVMTMAVPVPGSSLVRGRTTLTVNAPIAKVRSTVLDFKSHPEFMPYYTKCKVLGRTASQGREVYLEMAALSGAVKMWARVEVSKATIVDGVETYETRMLEGNVKDLRAVWRMRKIDDNRTELSLESFLHPSLPLPSSMINKENVAGSAKSALAMRARIEG